MSPESSKRQAESDGKPAIPDHELIRSIGTGGYGEVWLARNVIGGYRAIKVVYRRTFESELPYEREFADIKRFEPLSRSHDGFVDVLQVGRNDAAGYFYYVMELADDGATEIPPQAKATASGPARMAQATRRSFEDIATIKAEELDEREGKRRGRSIVSLSAVDELPLPLTDPFAAGAPNGHASHPLLHPGMEEREKTVAHGSR